MAAILCGGIGELHARAFAMVLQQGVGEVTDGCESAKKWLLVNVALCFVSITMAAYISNKVQMEKGLDVEEDRTLYQVDFNNTRNNSAARINKILCHDSIVTVYILVGCAIIFWQFEGIFKNYHGYNNNFFVSNVLI
eukprot:15356776-Ditylum_brightwellii.AAC.1